MRKNNELNIFKSQKNNPRILKISQLIKKTLSKVFLTLDFTDEEGESVIFFVNEVSLSRDARIATIFITNFSNKKLISSQQLKNIIDNNLSRIKRDFSSRIELRYTPKLKFKLDVEREKFFKLDKAIDKLE
jgi:ribosome-binding factor A